MRYMPRLPATHFQWFGEIRPFTSYFSGPVLADGSRERVDSAFEIFLPTCLLMLGNQSMYQKFFSAKSEKDATRATVGWIIGTVILETIIVVIAVVGSAIYRSGEVHDRPREILAYTAVHSFGGSKILAVLGALLVGAIFAKVVSTANNYLFSPATNLVNDVFVRYLKPEASNKQVLLVSRLMVVALGGWSLFQALHVKSVLHKSLYAYTIYGAALTPVILAAFFCDGRQRRALWPPLPPELSLRLAGTHLCLTFPLSSVIVMQSCRRWWLRWCVCLP